MSWQSDITQAIATLTQRLNDITTSAKKIFELPWQNILNPASEIHVSISGESQKINVQQILDAALSFKRNQLVEANITVDGNDVTVDSGAKWIINNINHELVSDFVETVPYAEIGYTRNDILVGNESNFIYRIAGPETEGISPTPNIPINTVLITTINVTDSTIGDNPPIIGDDFEVKTNKQDSLDVDGTGTLYPTVDAVNDGLDLKLNVADYNEYYLGKYTSLANLEAAHPIGFDGASAVVDAGPGTEAIEYIWDEDEGWVAGGSAGGGTTDDIINNSDVDGTTTTDALNALNTGKANDDNVLHITGNEGWAGIKSSTNTGATQINGVSFTNNGTLGSSSLSATNTSTGSAIYTSNVSTGQSMLLENLDSGNNIISRAVSGASGFNYVGQNDTTNTFTVNGSGSGYFASNIGVNTSFFDLFGFGSFGGGVTTTKFLVKINDTYTGIAPVTNGSKLVFGRDNALSSPNEMGSINCVTTSTANNAESSYLSFFTKSGVVSTSSQERMRITETGVVNIPNLSGTGTRQVVADASGNLSANNVLITITTSVSITTATTDSNSVGQDGHHVVIDNGVNAINLTCNGGVTTSYGKVGTGAITFVQGSGRTLVQLSGTAVLSGIAGSTASLWSNGTTDYLSINNY